MQSMMTDLGLTAQVRVWTDSNAAKANCVKNRPWEDQTCGIGTRTAAGGDQTGKSENEEGRRTANFGRPPDEENIVA